MPGPSPKLLQLGHDNAVVDLVPTVHDQMAGHGIHGVELAAGVGGTQHRLVVCAGSDGMREACDSGVTRARGVNGRDIGRLCAERTAIVEANGAGSTHGHDDPGDIGLTSELRAASSEAPEVSSSTLAPAFSAMPVILA